MIKALLFTDKKFTEEEKAKLTKSATGADIDLSVTSSVKSFFQGDVLLVQDKLTSRIKRSLNPSSKLILIKDQQTDISEVFRMAQELDSFTILNFPINRKTIFKAIKEAHAALVEEKKSRLKETRRGRTLAVTSFKGGAGKSLLSYNLAFQLARFLKDNQILLIDFSRPFGSSRAFLNIEGKFSWDTVRPLLQENRTLSKNRLFGVLNFTPYDFSLLASPEDLKTNTPLEKNELEILNESAKENFSLIIEDFSAITQLKDFDLVTLADNIIVVLTPEPSNIFNTYKALSYLKKNQPKVFDKMLFVVNKIESRSPVTCKVLEDKLKIKILGKIEEDVEAVNVHLAKALPFDDDSLIITQDLKNLAERVFKALF